jgi:SPP1 family predicted phage head-tail adaptor
MTLGFDDTILEQARSDVLQLLYDTAVIQKNNRVDDGAGGWTDDWVAVSGGTVLARVDPKGQTSSANRVEIGREITTVEYQLTMPYDAPLVADRRVVINGNTYEIVQLDVDHSRNVSKRATITEVR